MEASGADFDLTEYMERIDPERRSSNDEYANRLRVCETCDYLNDGLCRACGCFVALRALTAARHCPYERW